MFNLVHPAFWIFQVVLLAALVAVLVMAWKVLK
jgi:hypothetical protein